MADQLSLLFEMYTIVTIPADAPEASEPLGTKDKFWYGDQFLFKKARGETGEDWSEKVCAELADRLGVPHAEYELADWQTNDGSVRGVTSRNFCPTGATLILGNELLAEVDPDYAEGTVSKFRVPAHTLGRIAATLRNRSPNLPLGWTLPPFARTALDVFVGYLLLDAVVGNGDRHHENWGVIRMANGETHLAPTFDHASSLGRNLLDEERSRRLQTKDAGFTIEAFARRARSALYRSELDRKPLLILEAFQEAARLAPAAALGWMDVLAGITDAEVAILVDDVPPKRISDIAAEFAKRLLFINKKRVIELKKELQ